MHMLWFMHFASSYQQALWGAAAALHAHQPAAWPSSFHTPATSDLILWQVGLICCVVSGTQRQAVAPPTVPQVDIGVWRGGSTRSGLVGGVNTTL